MATNGIDFVIGGKDQAKPAMSAVEKSLERLEAKTESLGRATKMLGNITAGLAVAYGTIQSALTILGGLDKINTAYDEQAEAVKGLEVALKLQGAAVETESARLQDFSNQVQDLTGINDDMTMGLMRQAAMLGTESDKLDDMAKAAIGLGEAMGTDAASAMSILRAATEGHFDAMNKVIPSIRGMATDQEKLNAVLELAGRGFESASTWSSAVAESGGKASIAIDSLMESVGAIIAPFRTLINAGITALAESLSHLLTPAVQHADEMLANIGPTVEWVKGVVFDAVNTIVKAFTLFEVVVTNLDGIWTIIVSQVELSMRQIGEIIMYYVSEVIPSYVMWFGENIINLFRDAFNGVLAIVQNSTRMIGEIMLEMWKFIFEDMGQGSAALGDRIGAILASGLTNGFQSSLTDLPDIAARQITEREKELADTIGQVGANIGDEFSRKMRERMVGAGGEIGDGIAKGFDLSVNSIADASKANAKRKDGTVGTSINAMESRLLTRGPSSTYESRMLSATERIGQILLRTGEWVKATAEELKEMKEIDPTKIRFVQIP